MGGSKAFLPASNAPKNAPNPIISLTAGLFCLAVMFGWRQGRWVLKSLEENAFSYGITCEHAPWWRGGEERVKTVFRHDSIERSDREGGGGGDIWLLAFT